MWGYIHATKDPERCCASGDAVDERERDRDAGRLPGPLTLLRFKLTYTGNRCHGPEQGHEETGPQDYADHGGFLSESEGVTSKR